MLDGIVNIHCPGITFLFIHPCAAAAPFTKAEIELLVLGYMHEYIIKPLGNNGHQQPAQNILHSLQ
jgi:hypothetical protein